MNTDPIADMLTRIRNAASARKSSLHLPASELKKNVLAILEENGYVKKVSEAKTSQFPELVVEIDIEKPITIRRISKPGQRIYSAGKDLKPVLNGLGISVISTTATDDTAGKALLTAFKFPFIKPIKQ